MPVRAALPLPTEVDRMVRQPYPFEDYLALPEWHRAEYVDGVALVSPSAVASHQRVSRRVANAVDAGCPGLFVVEAVGVWTGERRSRIPDVLATGRPFEGSWSDQVPVLVVEILSPSTRGEDTLRKSTEYLAAGIAQYWIVDREHGSLTALAAAQDGWSVVLELEEDRPVGVVPISADGGTHGEVDLDLTALLAT